MAMTTTTWQENVRYSRNKSQRLYRHARNMARNADNAREHGHDDVAEMYDNLTARFRIEGRHQAANARFYKARIKELSA